MHEVKRMEKSPSGNTAEEDHTLLKPTKFRIIKNICVVSSSFLLLFTAYDGLGMLQSTMNTEGGIGTICQGLIYLIFCISSMLLPKYVIRILGCKVSLIACQLLYIPYIAANFYPHWATMIPASILIGIAASVLWGAQCTYFNESSFLYCSLVGNNLKKEKSGSHTLPNDKIFDLITLSNSQCKKQVQLGKKHSNCANTKDHSLSGTIDEDATARSAISYNLPKDKATNQNADLNERRNLESGLRIKNQFYLTNEIKFNENSECYDITTLKEEKQITSTTESTELQSYRGISDYCIINSNLNKDVQVSGAEVNYRNSGKTEVNTNSKKYFADREAINGRFFGFFGLVYESANIWSNLLSYYILKIGSSPSETDISSCSCGADFCNLYSECVKDNIGGITDDRRNVLICICVTLGIIAILELIVFLDPLEYKKEQEKGSENFLLATFNHCKKLEQIFLIPITFFIGMARGFYTADITKHFTAYYLKKTKKQLLLRITSGIP